MTEIRLRRARAEVSRLQQVVERRSARAREDAPDDVRQRRVARAKRAGVRLIDAQERLRREERNPPSGVDAAPPDPSQQGA